MDLFYTFPRERNVCKVYQMLNLLKLAKLKVKLFGLFLREKKKKYEKNFVFLYCSEKDRACCMGVRYL
jgi:hypothetical protein